MKNKFFTPLTLLFYGIILAIPTLVASMEGSPNTSTENSLESNTSNESGETGSEENKLFNPYISNGRYAFAPQFHSGADSRGSQNSSHLIFYNPQIPRSYIPQLSHPSFDASQSDSSRTPMASLASSSESQSLKFDASDDEMGHSQTLDDIKYYYSKNFTEYFYQLTTPSLLPHDKNIVWKHIHDLGRNFVEDAIKYGKIIIEERDLPDGAKSIHPLQLGGVAGGDKYICNGIIFKLPKDKMVGDKWIYGGDHPAHDKATEAAIIELVSSNYAGSFTPSLISPLTAVVSYGGFLVMATSVLPINDRTLVYGSADAGRTVYATHLEVNTKAHELGEALNLKPHELKDEEMALCGDIEIHQTQFAPYGHPFNFIIDPARLFPPEYPDINSTGNTIHWEKLPPEFVRKYPKPLSADAFTGFQTSTEAPVNNQEVIEATEVFYKTHLPKYTQMLLNSEVIRDLLSATSPYHTLFFLNKPMENHQDALISHMHNNGVNMRHLGKIVQILDAYKGKKVREAELLKNYIHNVIISRAIQEYINVLLKDKNKFTERKEVLRSILNEITTPSLRRSNFWTNIVPLYVSKKFNVDIKNIPLIINKGFQLVTFCRLMGISLSAEVYEELKSKYGSRKDIRRLTKVFSADEFQISPTIQYSNFIDLATGIHYLNEHNINKNIPHMSGYASNSRRISYNRLKSALETWTNLEHPILPNKIEEIVQQMKEEILAEKQERQALTPSSALLPSSFSISDDSEEDSNELFGKDKEKKKPQSIPLKQKVQRIKKSLWGAGHKEGNLFAEESAPRFSRAPVQLLNRGTQIPKTPKAERSTTSKSMSMGQWQQGHYTTQDDTTISSMDDESTNSSLVR